MTNIPVVMRDVVERSKPGFSPEHLLDARKLAWEAVQKIHEQIQPGMFEKDAVRLAGKILKDLGAERCWHQTFVRFGANTLKTFNNSQGPSLQLQENDIYYIDIGPVFGEYEGDAGATFVTGTDPEMLKCRDDSKKIFEMGHQFWKQNPCTGKELYQYFKKASDDLGWELLPKIDGHRLSDFSHFEYSKSSLNAVEFIPSPHLWVAEIQIRHKTRDFGAFYEDLLF